MDNLIFDRLSSDVDNALNNPNSTQDLKGAYNYSDLNRVESWCEYLQYFLEPWGFKEKLTVKKNWNIRDYPTRTEIDRIRQNIDTLKEFCYAIQTRNIVYNNTLNYDQANVLEQILYDIKRHIEDNEREIDLSYIIAPFTMSEKFYELYMNEDVLKRKRQVDLNDNIGTTVVRTAYCSFCLDVHKKEKETKMPINIASFTNRYEKIKITLDQDMYAVKRKVDCDYNIASNLVRTKYIKLEGVY